ncbi:solute carrier family 12 member 9 [Drosophila tropicalis]|uniref:solute carrier family 12 member 9 n=1 Tax=Drosophila tropicalis TaxID=46794 RepID=UPI0035AB8BC6
MSINTDQETAPIATPRNGSAANVFRSFGSLFGGANNDNNSVVTRSSSGDGYVEFGMQDPERNGRTLGTFAGVFSPVALSMFSALIFIRVGYIVGNAGLYITLLQFIIAYAILIFTVASVCAISTNGAIEGGGVYFMISRTLGLEFGGSIGTLFFFANVVGSAMAISGCTEGIMNDFGPESSFGVSVLPGGPWWSFLVSSLINTCMLLVCLVGAALFAKTSVIILGTVIICLFATYISFLAKGETNDTIPDARNATGFLNYTGLSAQTLRDNLGSHYGVDYTSNSKPVDFSTTFGVLFSGVTGIMAGANMSGELKSPSKSIPWGTLSAVAFTFVSYIILSFLMSCTTPFATMQNNYLFLMPINLWPPFTAIGILTATFSTGLSNLIGSSRILEALSKDQVFGSLLNFVLSGTWKGNPIAAVVVSWCLVECVLLIGSFNIIAQINSVLFMLSYLATNLACLGIELTGAPNFRPLFKYFTWHTCLVGLLGTLIMMFVINPIYASSCIILCLILVIALHLFSPATQAAQWGSISQALMFHQVRKYLLMLDPRKDHVKFWRPQILLLVSSPRSCCPLVDFVNDMKKSGLYIIGHVKLGDFRAVEDPEENQKWWSFLDHMRVKAFTEVTLSRSIREGVQHLIRLSGIGAMKPNTIILGFYDNEAPKDFFQNGSSPYKTDDFNNGDIQSFPIRRDGEPKHFQVQEYVQILCDTLRMKKNLCLCRNFQRLDKNFISISKHVKFIDVWPINIFNPTSGDPFDMVSLFMMQLAVIMLAKWKHLRVRIFLCETNEERTVGTFETQAPQMEIFSKMKLEQSLKELRINADIIEIQEWSRDTDFSRLARTVKQYTAQADETLLSDDDDEASEDKLNRSLLYMQRANQIIRQRSDQTALSFIYLAAPPKLSVPDFNERSANYVELLTELTAELPPTILVHGVSTVTSTTL